MNKITITATYEIETEHALDDATVKAIATAMNEGISGNVDDQTAVEPIEMIATFQTTVSVLDAPVLGYDDTSA